MKMCPSKAALALEKQAGELELHHTLLGSAGGHRQAETQSLGSTLRAAEGGVVPLWVGIWQPQRCPEPRFWRWVLTEPSHSSLHPWLWGGQLCGHDVSPTMGTASGMCLHQALQPPPEQCHRFSPALSDDGG